ncbi:Chaperone protein DnaJ [Cocos nucifera]|nr:Chaperone protein DnaJ [Cocos nucifera]
MEISMGTPSVASSCSDRRIFLPFLIKESLPTSRFLAFPANSPFSRCNSTRIQIKFNSINDLQRCRTKLESLFCYDKSIPEEAIEEPVGVTLSKKEIGNNPPCVDCQAKGAVLCATCSGSGLYIDSILESQGIIVKVRCLGCGGTGNIMCSRCGGRGHSKMD